MRKRDSTKGEKKVILNWKQHIFVAVVIILLIFPVIPIKTANATINMRQSRALDHYRVWTYSQVYHRVRSYYYTEDDTFWVTRALVERRYTDYHSSGLLSGGSVLSCNNVLTAYTTNVCLSAGIRLYHYTPVDGTGDYWNNAGWATPLAYVTINYNLPSKTTNHCIRTGGTLVNNGVYPETWGTLKFKDARAWSSISTANAVRYNTGSPGSEVDVYIWSYSWDLKWEWFRWRSYYYWDESTFSCNY